MNKTTIEWTDFSANPLKFRDASGRVVWHCEKLSPGCKNCYAEAIANRWRRGGPFNAGVTRALTPFLDEDELHKLLTAKAIAGKRVFIGDMTDVFGEWIQDEDLDGLFALFALRTDVTWQVLTKRPERAREYIQNTGRADLILACEQMSEAGATGELLYKRGWPELGEDFEWPLPNVWLGVSCEDQERADERIPHLLQTPAAVRFISAEPLLGPLDLSHYLGLDGKNHGAEFLEKNGWGYDDWSGGFTGPNTHRDSTYAPEPGIHWVIPGGVEWMRALVQQCQAAEVSCFVKQLGADPIRLGTSQEGRLFVRLNLRDRQGRDPSEWPEALRVREFPSAEARR
jgi:protein gp37